ncbi:MAG: hypothetical protein ABJI96_09355 [Paracoccaceae bacterium]
MTRLQLCENAESMGRQIASASPVNRRRMQPEFNRVLVTLRSEGVPVPAHLRKLDSELLDEVIEARFDNMPV